MAFGTPDVLTQFGIEEEVANNYMFNAISSNNVQFNNDVVAKARSFPANMQAGCARLLVKMLRRYNESDHFAKAYKKDRNGLTGGKPRGFHIPKPSELLDKAKNKLLNANPAEPTLPANPRELVKMRLEEFLKTSATVDFDAQLNVNMFVNPVYEAKSNQ